MHAGGPSLSPTQQSDAGDWAGIPTMHGHHAPCTECVTSCRASYHARVCYISLVDTWGVTPAFRRADSPIVPCQCDAGGELMGMLGLCPSPHSLVVNCLGRTSYAFPD